MSDSLLVTKVQHNVFAELGEDRLIFLDLKNIDTCTYSRNSKCHNGFLEIE